MKKFQAKSMAEAMKMVKTELGPNAIILHTRDLGKGLLGFFMGKGVEVTAAVEPKDDAKARPRPQPVTPPPVVKTPTRHPSVGQTIDFQVGDAAPLPSGEENPLLALSKKLQEEKRQEMAKSLQNIPGMPDLSKKNDGETPPNKAPEPPQPLTPTPDPSYLEERLKNMETQLVRLSGLLETITPSLVSGHMPAVPTRARELYNHLLEQDVDERLALSIATHIAEITDENDDIWTALKSHLTTLIQCSEPIAIDPKAKQPKLIMLVGPTGVGKTTTIAKISARYRYSTQTDVKSKLSFITADLYRLAAVEQLQKYSEILGVDLEVTYSPDEVKEALKKHKNDHLLLFDTAGACQRNMPQMSTLAAIVEASEPTEVHLVLSATTKFSDMIDIVEHFKEIKPTHLIFTKIDESTTFGSILNTLVKYKIPVSYVTTGQNVPEDIEIAKSDRIAKLLLQKPAVNRSLDKEDIHTPDRSASDKNTPAKETKAQHEDKKEKTDSPNDGKSDETTNS